jgi:SAM-dependent methyltransferase
MGSVVSDFDRMERNGWERASALYDSLLGKATEPLASALVDLAGISADEVVLDVASGPGYVAVEARRKGGRVVAVDRSEGMIDQLRSYRGRLSMVRADAIDLPFADGTFDVVLAAFYLNHLDDPRIGLAEMSRVLRPGGRMAASVWDVPERARHNGLIEEAVVSTLGSPPKVAQPSSPLPKDTSGLAALVQKGGLVAVLVRIVPGYVKLSGPENLLELAEFSTTRSAALVRTVPPHLRRELESDLRRRMRPFWAGAGDYALPTPSVMVLGSKPET